MNVNDFTRESAEDRFSAVLEQAPFSIQVMSPDGRILRVNRAWEELWGVRLEQIEGYNILEDPQLEEKGVMPYVRRAFAGEAVEIPPVLYDPNATIPDVTRHADAPRWTQAVIYPIKDGAGRVREVVLMHEDITARVAAEEGLRRSEARYRALFETTTDGIMVVDDAGRYVDVNESLCRILKAPRERLVGSHFSDHMLPDRLEEAARAFAGLRETGGYVGTFPVRAADGSVVDLEWTSRADFMPGLHVCVARDVTERRLAEESLRESESRYQRAAESGRVGVWDLDLATEDLYLAPNLKALLGYGDEELPDRLEDWCRLVHPDDKERVVSATAAHVEGRTERYEAEVRRRHKDGRYLWFLAQGVAVRDEAGRAYRLTGSDTDITERKLAEAEKARLAAQVEEQRHRLQAMVASVPGVVWEAWGEPDAAGQRLDFVSDYVEAMLGYSKEEWLSEPNFWLKIVHPEDRDHAARTAAENFARGTTGVNRFRWLAKDGRVVWVESRSTVIADASGRPAGLRGVSTDITERVRDELNDRFLGEASKSLSSSLDYETTLRTVARLSVPHFADWCAVDVLDEGGTLRRLAVAHVDPAKVEWAHEIHRRYPPDPGEERGLYYVLRTGESEYYPEITDEMLVQGMRDEEQLRIMREVGFRSVLIVPLKTRERVLGAITFVNAESGRHHTPEDLSFAENLAARASLAVENARLYKAERQTRKAAERTADRLARLQEVSAAVSQAITPPEVAAAVVRQGRSSLGAHAGVVVKLSGDGANLEIIGTLGFPPEVLEKWKQFPLTAQVPIADAVRTKLPVLVESLPEWADRYPGLGPLAAVTGSQSLIALPLIVKGRTTGALGLSFLRPQRFSEEDRAFMLALAHQCALALERARLYETEQRLRAEAEDANRLKDEFLATVSHELRTPLTAIVGWAGMLRANSLDARTTARAMESIERNARAQTQIIEDLLDVSRIITGKLTLDARRVDLAAVVESAVESVRPAAAAKGIGLRAEAGPEVCPAWGDPARLQQVVWNLLSNAVKFTPEGGEVLVLLERVDSRVRVVVTDTGQGISPDFLPYVFDRFRQADQRITRRHGGLGLGLSIVRHLVELHGGTVSAESAGEGLGSTFTVDLPDAASASAAPGQAHAAEPAGGAEAADSPPDALNDLRVLLVDDEPDARLLLSTVLEQRGAVVSAVGSAAEALAALAQFGPDILVSDIGMPDEDGYSLMRKVRALGPEEGGRIPAVALTAYAREDDRLRALLAGFQVHVAKPVNPAEFVAVVAGLAGVAPRK